MAKSAISVRNGAVALPTGYNLDSQSMRIREAQSIENVTFYGASLYGAQRGNGTPIQSITVTGFPFKGNGAGSSNVGFGVMSAANGDLGSAATFTIDTGVTLAGQYLVASIDMDHARIQAAARTTLELTNAGDPTITWAT